jgi:hypothetical protein
MSGDTHNRLVTQILELRQMLQKQQASNDKMAQLLKESHQLSEKLVEVLEGLDSNIIMREYDEELRKHPHFKQFIERTPFENDCSAIAARVVRTHLTPTFW